MKNEDSKNHLNEDQKKHLRYSELIQKDYLLSRVSFSQAR